MVVGLNTVQHSKIKKDTVYKFYIANSSVDNRSEAPRGSTAVLHPYDYYLSYVLPDLSWYCCVSEEWNILCREVCGILIYASELETNEDNKDKSD